MTIYLYVKTHLITGLKYLGQTSAKDPHKYSGSGLYWKLHLEKHGYLYNTEILKECHSKDEVKDWGTYYSNLWNVVDSNDWANLKPESGDGGAIKGINLGRKHTEKTIEKMSKARKGKGTGSRRPLSEEHKKHLSKLNKGKQRSRESVKKQLQTKLKKGQISQIGQPLPKLKQAYIDGGYTGPVKIQWITNGIESQQILVYDKIPEGWRVGRHVKCVPPSQKGKIWITDGITTKMATEIPPGWRKGRKVKQ